jgi:hypothetical protein
MLQAANEVPDLLRTDLGVEILEWGVATGRLSRLLESVPGGLLTPLE